MQIYICLAFVLPSAKLRFTSGVHVLEYTFFLNRLVGRITEFDEATGEVMQISERAEGNRVLNCE